MKKHLEALLVASLSIGFLAGCPKDEPRDETSAPTAKEKKKAKAPASASAAPSSQRHDLSPMPLTIELPAHATVREKRAESSLIDVDGGGLNVSTDDFDSKKNTVKNFPFDTFQRWVTDEDKHAVAEMGSGTPNYRALRVFEVEGTTYVCSNVGTTGVATIELAEKIVGYCNSLAAKK